MTPFPPQLCARKPNLRFPLWAEVKWDGIRLQVHRANGRTRAWTRHLTEIDPPPRIDVDAVLDGELVQGQFIAFDVIRVGSHAVHAWPRSARRQLLETLAPCVSGRMIHCQRELSAMYAMAKLQGLEGLVLKRETAYQFGRRTKDWSKLK